MATEATGKSTVRFWVYSSLIVLALSALPFITSLMGQAVWDDFGILNGSSIGGGADIKTVFTYPFNHAYYRPAVSLSFFIDRQMFGTSPFFYHQTNILIHLATVVLVGMLGWRLFRNRWMAVGGALLFGIQPVQASAVAWIGGRTDSLCALFVAAFAVCIVHAVKSSRGAMLWHVGSALALLAAMLCKEQAAVLVFSVPIAIWLLSPAERKSSRAMLSASAPYVGAVFFFILLWLTFSMTKYEAADLALAEQLSLGGRGLLHNFGLLFAPTQQSLHTYTLEFSKGLGWPPIALGYLLLLGSIWGIWKTRKERPEIAWLGSTVLLTMLPVSNVIPLPSLLVAPYRMGICGVGLAVLLGYVLVKVASKGIWAKVGVAALASYAFWTTTVAASQWTDEKTLFTEIVRRDPAFLVGRTNLNSAHDTTPETALKNTQEALDWVFQGHDWRATGVALSAFATDPAIAKRVSGNVGNKTFAHKRISTLFLGLGIAQKDTGDTPAAIDSLRLAAAFDPLNGLAYIGLGEISIERQNFKSAERYFRQSLAAMPGYFTANLLLAQVLIEQGRSEEAVAYLEGCISGLPWMGLPYLMLAELWVEDGDLDEARSTIDEAVSAGAVDPATAEEWLSQNLRSLAPS